MNKIILYIILCFSIITFKSFANELDNAHKHFEQNEWDLAKKYLSKKDPYTQQELALSLIMIEKEKRVRGEDINLEPSRSILINLEKKLNSIPKEHRRIDLYWSILYLVEGSRSKSFEYLLKWEKETPKDIQETKVNVHVKNEIISRLEKSKHFREKLAKRK